MNLSGLLTAIEGAPALAKLASDLEAGRGERRVVVLDAARPAVIASLYRHLGVPALVITASPERARQLHDEIPAWLGNDGAVELFPEPDALPYERLATDAHTVRGRLKVLFRLVQQGGAPLVIASAHAVSRTTVPVSRFASSCDVLRSGMEIELEGSLARWMDLGYEMESVVEYPGTMGRRGGIIDLYSPGGDLPARIELFGNRIESIRLFDPASQRSIRTVERVDVIPAREMVSTVEEVRTALAGLDLSALGGPATEQIEEDVERLASGQWVEGIDFYASLVNDGVLLDYLPPGSLVVVDEPDRIESALADLEDHAKEMRRAQAERGALPPDFPLPHLQWPDL